MKIQREQFHLKRLNFQLSPRSPAESFYIKPRTAVFSLLKVNLELQSKPGHNNTLILLRPTPAL